MASQGKRASTKKSTNGFEWTFVNFRPTEDDIQDINAMYDEGLSPMAVIEALVRTGHKLSVKFDDYNQSSQASLSCNDAEGINAKRSISTRHINPMKALYALYYAYNLVKEDDWTSIDTAYAAPDY